MPSRSLIWRFMPFTTCCAILLVVIGTTSNLKAQPSNPGFTYQGVLDFEDMPANGQYDLTIRFYRSPTEPGDGFDKVVRNDVEVIDGIFSARFDLDNWDALEGEVWMQVEVKPAGTDSSEYVVLSGRNLMDSVPYALRTEGIFVDSNGRVGIGNTNPSDMLHVSGTVRAQSVRLIAGADIAEPFDIAEDAKLQPGMVVAIDPANPGGLRIADRAYDSTVAGIVSGAGGINTGLTLSQEGTIADGEHPVALTGRVWCYVDAEANGPVMPGDLLTTSDTFGHAMRASDRDRAFGSTIGKAMTPLESGRGLVLVLVNMQ